MSSTTTSTESRALTLLGQGVGPEMVASALGVSVSRISQLLSDPNFASEVASLRFTNLSKHAERDSKYDSLEDQLLDKMRDLLPMMYKPLEILRAIQTINAAKRRGSSTPEAIIGQKTVVSLVMPTQITQIFAAQNTALTVNTQNQVVKVGDTDLVTVQSMRMDSLLEASKKGAPNGNQTTLTIENSASQAN